MSIEIQQLIDLSKSVIQILKALQRCGAFFILNDCSLIVVINKGFQSLSLHNKFE
jgi:hypothetical protein